MIEFEINGKKVTAEEGATIIEAADALGIYIPRFCYHKKLSIAANCRMCLVEVEKSKKPLPACATPITKDMKVLTQSKCALDAQRDVMEFLLINHPLDCPICDQGGECELQDLSLGFGRSHSVYDQPKRAVVSPDIGPLIETEMTRCIQCTRCVRFGEEIAGLRELGVVNRGEKEEITTYVKHFLKSEVSGNIIDICPVGALTNKPARYEMRAWEIKESPSISPHDCVGTNLYLHTRKDSEYSEERTVFRAVPRENESINETWISDRDRFSVEALYHEDRVKKPLMKKNNAWIAVDWKTILSAVMQSVFDVKEKQGADQIAGIAGYSATLEEYYLFQKLIRALGSPHVDHRIRELDTCDQMHRPLFPQLNTFIQDIEQCDVLLLVGAQVRYEQPVINMRIFKATQNGLTVMAIHSAPDDFVYSLSESMMHSDIVQSLAEVAKAMADLKSSKIAGLESIAPSVTAKNIANKLLSAKKAALFFGADALRHPHASILRELAHHIGMLSNVVSGSLTEGANSAGAWIAGCVPHRIAAGAPAKTIGHDAKSLFTAHPVSAYFILDTELESDAVFSSEAVNTLSQSKCVVCFNTFMTEKMREYAHFILPITPFSENEGTFVNVNGVWQSFGAASIPHADSKPAWKVLRALSQPMQLPGFAYHSVTQIRDEIKKQMQLKESLADTRGSFREIFLAQKESPHVSARHATKSCSLKKWHMYRDNALVRRAKSLQHMISESQNHVHSN